MKNKISQIDKDTIHNFFQLYFIFKWVIEILKTKKYFFCEKKLFSKIFINKHFLSLLNKTLVTLTLDQCKCNSNYKIKIKIKFIFFPIKNSKNKLFLLNKKLGDFFVTF